MKKILLTVLFSTMFVMPTFGGQNIINTTQENAIYVEQHPNITEYDINDQESLYKMFYDKLYYVTDSYTRYTTERVNIRNKPGFKSDILDTTLIGTSVEVVLEIGRWSMVTTSNGYAFMVNDYFTDVPLDSDSYSAEDLYIMAHLLAGECQSCSDEEQRYVGSVALNRVASDKFPNTLKEVVFQKGQYACTWDGNYYRTPTEKNWENAKWLLENGSIFPMKVVFQSGSKQGKVYLKTEHHYYCY